MKMFRTILLLCIPFIVFANTYVVIDLSKGMKRSAYNELGKLAMPGKSVEDCIYTPGERVVLYAFKGRFVKLKDFIYYPENISEAKNRKARKTYFRFFSIVKKGLKPPKKERIDANVVFVVDTSGSMVTSKADHLSAVKRAMKTLVRNKSKKARISIITFDGKKKMPKSERSHVLIDNEWNKQKLFAAIDAIHVSKNDTYLGSGLQKAKSVIPYRSKRKSVVMIFTDGAEINDFKEAKKEIEELKKMNVEVKVVAIGGADVSMLKNFSTSGYVYNATSGDLEAIIKDVSMNRDEIVLRLDYLTNRYSFSPKDRVIIYSSMQNIDSVSDFTLVPNIASEKFYKEFMQQNKKRGVSIDFKHAKIYVRLLGSPDIEEVKKLSIFWKHFFRDTHGELVDFTDSGLDKTRLK